ncbi:mitochondria protoheme IX farnesyltransferase [Nadsonia fulvescens var. elongata DSM 6958]|uniref:Protoheme IX farnesyltransferase, mitochondrial n=1 Tax=Nadsonia fulvescens var. elongata DSM 6958 TaxID=857566 RepID=A0A1E3PP24_9ASCO|nr:mitochondria protoheme IX farnesyltransferase [Nadsonia fulvescens var. elongata DSM 6958]
MILKSNLNIHSKLLNNLGFFLSSTHLTGASTSTSLTRGCVNNQQKRFIFDKKSQLYNNSTLLPNTNSKFSFFQNTVIRFGSRASSSKPASNTSPESQTPISNENGELLPKKNSVVESVAAKAFTCQSSAEKSIPISPAFPDVKAKEPRAKELLTSKSILDPYLALTKPRLTFLVVLSAMSAYALTPQACTLSELFCLTIGTALSSGAANAINMGREPEFDAQMTRTKTRPVVRGLLTPEKAYTFAGIVGTAGVAALYFGVNPTVAALGAANIVLYSGIYTSMKRMSIANTWVGAVVGAIPPLMGWAASSSLWHPGAWCLAGLLYAWQFPHFNALSYTIREEYRKAGYIMAAWTNPKLNARVALRYSILMVPLCIGLSVYNVTDWVFPIDSGIVNGILIFQAYKFWNQQRLNDKAAALINSAKGAADALPAMAAKAAGNNNGSSSHNAYARSLFWGSVIHLPGVLVLAMIHKKGQWDWLFGSDDDDLLEVLEVLDEA